MDIRLDCIINEISTEYVEVTSNGSKTYGNLITELYALVDMNKVTNDAYVTMIEGSNTYKFTQTLRTPSRLDFSLSGTNASMSEADISSVRFMPNYMNYGNFAVKVGSTTYTNSTNSKPASGTKIRLYY